MGECGRCHIGWNLFYKKSVLFVGVLYSVFQRLLYLIMDGGRTLKYDLHMLLRKVVMRLAGISCGTCRHYDGSFGDDTCFPCEQSIKAVGYERR